MTEILENKEFSENEETSEDEVLENEETSKDEETLCRFRTINRITIELYEFNLKYPFEIFRSSAHDNSRSLVATIQPRNKKFQEDEGIVSLSIHIGNRICYNGHETQICDPDIKCLVSDGCVNVGLDGSLFIRITRVDSIKSLLYKTEMCRNWEERGSCRYGSKCQFAHSKSELRKEYRPKYKTEICKAFWQNGTCPYGNRCCFVHNEGFHKARDLD